MMQNPESLEFLIQQGIIAEVVRPLMSGKEAQVYLVISGGEERVAKVYKEANHRSFKHRSTYTEGRKVRNSRDQRAMNTRSRHGRARDEDAWRSTEVDMMHRLHAAGVRVPTPHQFTEGVLIMELIKDAEGLPAARLGDVRLDRDETIEVFDGLVREVVKMLCAGVVHGDLSDFNVLMSPAGPVVIDFPQTLDASANQNSRAILIRDVANLNALLDRFEPGTRSRYLAEEMWELYERGELKPGTSLTGLYQPPQEKADVASVMREIDDVRSEEVERRKKMGLAPLRPAASSAPARASRVAHVAAHGAGQGVAAAGAPPIRPRRRRRRRR